MEPTAPGPAGQAPPGPEAFTAVTDPLPSPLTSFVGRAAERAALADALGAHRLITALGPGGAGKTRLALSVGAEVAGRFADGAWFVDLVPVTDPSMIAPAIAAALGLCEHQRCPAEDTVLHWLAGRETLLVLDNCEHLLDGVAVLLERLLSGSPRLSVLVTSRARLLVPFEWVFPVHGLAVAADDGGPGDAVQLFLERAAAGGSPVRPEDTERVAAICRRLDGMALAIELTAARLPSLGLDGIEAGLADRLRLLTGGRRMNDRHRSLRSTLDWSYALLAGPDRAVLRRVSVFAAPFTAGAAAALLAGLAAGRRRRCRPGHPGRARRPEPAGRDPGSVRHPLPRTRDHPAVWRRPAGRRGRVGRGFFPSPELVPGRRRRPRAVLRRRRRLAIGVRSAGLRPAQRAALGGRPRTAPSGSAPAGDQAGRAELRPRYARRVAAAVRAGGRPGR